MEIMNAVFPAQAGVIPIATMSTRQSSGFPRASGGDPRNRKVEGDEWEFSPRKRG